VFGILFIPFPLPSAEPSAEYSITIGFGTWSSTVTSGIYHSSPFLQGISADSTLVIAPQNACPVRLSSIKIVVSNPGAKPGRHNDTAFNKNIKNTSKRVLTFTASVVTW
jgi:hypothetical protein